MNKYLAIRRSCQVLAAVLICGITAFYPVGAESLAETDNRKLDRLFSDMGVVKTLNALPVEVELKDPDGRTIRLSDFRGKIVFLNFWTTWCFDCRIEMPHMEKLHQQFKNKDFAMVTINLQESASQVKRFFNKFKLTFTTLLDSDGEIGARFRITAIPTTFILNKKGIIIGKVMGPRKWGGAKAIALFDYLTNRAVTTTSSLASAH
jgi:thiol-disulfide isomerase/thioredoxin